MVGDTEVGSLPEHWAITSGLSVNRPELRSPEISRPRCSLSALAIMHQLAINLSMDFGRAYSTLAHLPKRKIMGCNTKPASEFWLELRDTSLKLVLLD